MGYTTNFTGSFELNKQLTLDDYQWLLDFSQERHEGETFKEGMPGIWCDWIPNKNGRLIEWNGGEKFYDYVEWLEYLIAEFFIPKGYILNGEVHYQGEEEGDLGFIDIKDNKVSVRKGKIVYTEPEITYE